MLNGYSLKETIKGCLKYIKLAKEKRESEKMEGLAREGKGELTDKLTTPKPTHFQDHPLREGNRQLKLNIMRLASEGHKLQPLALNDISLKGNLSNLIGKLRS